jgi:hypothetical protein
MRSFDMPADQFVATPKTTHRAPSVSSLDIMSKSAASIPQASAAGATVRSFRIMLDSTLNDRFIEAGRSVSSRAACRIGGGSDNAGSMRLRCRRRRFDRRISLPFGETSRCVKRR